MNSICCFLFEYQMSICKLWYVVMGFIRKFFIGNSGNILNKRPKSAIKTQLGNIQNVWNSKAYTDFGIERIMRLFLVCIQILFPGLYIREWSGRNSTLKRKMFNEIYVIMKIILYILLLFVSKITSWISCICLYLMTETFCYLLGLIFLNTEYKRAASYRRNLLMAILNYVEITLGFATIYYHSFKDSIENLNTAIDSIYFSFISATTIGYGEMFPNTAWAKLVCVSQSFLSFLFAVIIIGIFLSNLNNRGFLNNGRKINSQNASNSQVK